MVGLIWATRGHSWDFRFLLRGGYSDPLPAYERVFFGMQGESAGCRRVGDRVALRFPDPLRRKDAAGRVIPHDFVVMAPLSDKIATIDDGLNRVWPLVSDIYAELWLGGPPASEDVESAVDGPSVLGPSGDG